MLKILSSAIICVIIGFDLFLMIIGIIEVIRSGRAPIQYSNKPTKTNPQRIIEEMDCMLADNMRRRDQQIQYQQQQQQQEQMQMQQASMDAINAMDMGSWGFM